MRRPLLALLASHCLIASTAFAAGDAKMGRVLAEHWCMSCHAGTGSAAASDSAPPFIALMRRTDRTREGLRTWLTNPHAPMPNLSLTRNEIDDLVAYLFTLRGR